MSGTSAGWTAERRARQSVFMVERNRDPAFADRRRKGQFNLSPEQRAARAAKLAAMNADPEFRAKQRAGVAQRNGRMHVVPASVHPCVRGLFVEMNAQLATRADIQARSSVSADAQSSWKRHCMPMLDMIDAALGALDFELAIVPRGSRDTNGFYKKPRAAAKGD